MLYGRLATSFVGAVTSAQIEGQGVAELQVDVLVPGKRFAERRLERAVELDRVHLRNPLGEVGGQEATTGADLEDDIGVVELREPADYAEDVLVCKEVLSELLLRPRAHGAGDPTGNENAAVALASICEARSSGCSPRACASAPTVSTTLAGSFGRPRRGTGARYGLSVSARMRSAGMRFAASRSSSALG